MKKLSGVAVLLALTFIAGWAWADVIGSKTSSIPVVVGDNEPCATVTPLQAVPIVTTRDYQRVVITFSGESTVRAPNFITWLNLDILLDGAAVSPTQTTDNAFVTAHGTNGLDGWVSASTSGVYVVPDPGLHRVLVQGSLINCSDAAPRDDQWRVDDFSTIVHSN